MVLEWYIENARILRGVSYLIILGFFLLWGASSVYNKMYHRAALKIGTSLMLLSFTLRILNPDPRISLYVTTPILVILALVVVLFIARIRVWF